MDIILSEAEGSPNAYHHANWWRFLRSLCSVGMTVYF